MTASIQIVLPQHGMNAFPIIMPVLGNNKKNIGQSSPFEGCLNNS
jgi:hypothetical protein